MKRSTIKAHRITSWLLVMVSFLTLFTGYTASRGLASGTENIAIHHIQFKWIFIILIIVHAGFVGLYGRPDIKKMLSCIREDRGRRVHILRFVQNVSAWFIILFTILIVFTGLPALNPTESIINEDPLFFWHRVLDVVLVGGIIIHSVVGLRFAMMRRRIRPQFADMLVTAVGVLLFSGTLLVL